MVENVFIYFLRKMRHSRRLFFFSCFYIVQTFLTNFINFYSKLKYLKAL